MSKTVVIPTVGELSVETMGDYVMVEQESVTGDKADIISIPMGLIPRFREILFRHLSDYKVSKDGDAS